MRKTVYSAFALGLFPTCQPHRLPALIFSPVTVAYVDAAVTGGKHFFAAVMAAAAVQFCYYMWLPSSLLLVKCSVFGSLCRDDVV